MDDREGGWERVREIRIGGKPVKVANKTVQAESMLHSLEQPAGDTGLYVNANKTEYVCFNREEAISTLNGGPPILVDDFTYLGQGVSSIDSDVNIRLTKALIAINRLSIIWKFNLSEKIKRNFFKATFVSVLLNGCITWTECREKKLDELHKNATSYIEQVLEAAHHQTTAVRQPTSYH